jgi:hypothetical protein
MSRAAVVLTTSGSPQLLDPDYNTIIYNATGGNITANLPAFSNVGSGVYFKFKRIDTTSNTVTISSVNSSTEKIDGNTSINFYPNDRYGVISYNSSWYTVDSPPYNSVFTGNTGPTGPASTATGPTGPNIPATTTTLGSIIVSTGLAISSSGALSVVYGATGAIQTSRISNSFTEVNYTTSVAYSTLTVSTYTKMTYNTVVSDVNSNFNLTTGLYTAPYAGTYKITVYIEPGNGAAYPTTSGNYAAGVIYGFGPLLSTTALGNNVNMVWNNTTGNGNGTVNVQYFILTAGQQIQTQAIINTALPTLAVATYYFAYFTAVLLW